jgi:hypothetical protein
MLRENGSVFGWGTMTQSIRLRVHLPIRLLNFSIVLTLLRCTALGSTQSLTEMSTRNFPGVKVQPAPKADNLTATCEPIVYKKGGSLDNPTCLHGQLRAPLPFLYHANANLAPWNILRSVLPSLSISFSARQTNFMELSLQLLSYSRSSQLNSIQKSNPVIPSHPSEIYFLIINYDPDTCYMLCPPYCSSLDYSIYTCRWIQFM